MELFSRHKPKSKELLQETTGDRIFGGFNTAFMIFLMIVCLYPIWFVVMASFSDTASIQANLGRLLWPHNFSIMAYRQALAHPLVVSGFRNIFFILIFSLPLQMIMTVFCGYFMSAKDMMFKTPIMIYLLFTMYFGGGLIPGYLNQRQLGLYNNLWALIIPGALSLYNAIVCKSAIDAIPNSLVESAYMDGATDFTILTKIVLPLIKPTLAVILLWYFVGTWNSWFGASIYIEDSNLLPIQNVLRSVLIANDAALNSAQGSSSAGINQFAETIKYSVIVISTLPVMCVYPFVQKYFTKGVMIGSLKG
ncbi:carbohydrate ABC transporter permease [Lacticaseibacillus jixiensis]|uniref:carbohydrate ABC transporter permease n=1 Tax=Lacticaseibacillus jixiensis TaxID=3231926 RepID=UPI0036F437FA